MSGSRRNSVRQSVTSIPLPGNGQAIVIVDPVSSGGALAFEMYQRGYAVISVFCAELTEAFRKGPDILNQVVFHAEIEEEEGAPISETAAAVKKAAGPLPIAACIVGGESGVTLADALSEALGVVTNGAFPGGDRRNKSVQQVAVKKAGLRAVREALGKEWHEVEAFVDKEMAPGIPVVLKPVESCGSDGVKLCKTKQDAKDHFKLLMEGQRKVGAAGAGVLCQEFLAGTEYVIDHVSRDGVHKTVMVYVYDKRPTNGAAFVYWNMIPVDSGTPEAQQLIKYTRGVLDALKLDNGPTHGEVMMTKDGPCLVEMNCRTHGWDGAWAPLCKALCGGYCQLDAGLDSHVNKEAFDKIPDVFPSPFKASGQTVMLVNYFSGVVSSMPGYDKMRKLSSFESLTTRVKVGSQVELTIDLFTAVGVLVLINSNKSQLEKDLAEVRKMEKEGLFTFESQIDPVQYEASPDTVNMSEPKENQWGRVRSMSVSTAPRSYEPKVPTLAIALSAFAAGVLVGVFARKR